MTRIFQLSDVNLNRTLAAALLLTAAVVAAPVRAEEGIVLPAPAVDAQASSVSQTAILAGGCFWGIQGVFQHVNGVTSAVSGYAGGDAASASYERVGTGKTRHAEAVRITFDPRKVSYGKLLQIFFSAAHDPTQLNRQGPDKGPQYRTAIFPQSSEQASVARAYIDQLGKARAFSRPIVTTIETSARFYAAEDYHQDFLVRNPTYPYIAYVDMPKIENLKRLFPKSYRQKPALVADTGTGE